MSEPSKIPQAWAAGGDINIIPDLDPGNGLASWELGYPIETQTPIAAGGTPPRRQDMNGALNWLSLYSLWNQQGGLWQYDAGEDYERGNVILQNNALYIAVAANGPSGTVKSPSADSAGTYWKKLVNSDGTLNVPAVGNATTSARGIVELATSAETKALTDGARAVTPSSLNGLLSLSPAALMVPKADSSAKLTGWLDAFKGGDGRVNISINGTAATLQTARTVRVNLASTSAASFDGSTNITPGVNGTLPVANGGTGQTNLDAVTVGKAKALNTARTVRTNLASVSAASFDGTANIAPGVSGVLPVANGGTGQNNLDAVTVGKAKALNTARTINGTSFNGTSNITTAQWGTARNVVVQDADGTNAAAAVSVNGGANITLKLPATIKATLSGNAATATQFKTARNINGTSFNGTASITTDQWGKSRNVTIKDASQSHTGAATAVNGSANFSLLLPATITAALNGNADTATKLKTARTINGTAFDGTANIIAMESSARSFGNNGYIKFQSGLMVQWGSSTFGSSKTVTVNLPTAFTSAVYVVIATDKNSTTSTGNPHPVGWVSGESSLSQIAFETNSGDTALFNWIAIGK